MVDNEKPIKWDNDAIESYRKWVVDAVKSYHRYSIRFTCEDFAIQLIVEFAWKNGLPVYISNRDVYSQGTTFQKGEDYIDFFKRVASSTGASDIKRETKLVGKSGDTSALMAAKPGDLIHFGSHVQVVVKQADLKKGEKQIIIAQGNFRRMSVLRAGCSIENALGTKNKNDPNDVCYIGRPIEGGIYDVSDKFKYKRYDREDQEFDKSGNIFKSKNAEVRRWDFKSWNKKARGN